MERRVELIREWNDGESIVALADSYGVSRKTIYKWIERHAAEGTAGRIGAGLRTGARRG